MSPAQRRETIQRLAAEFGFVRAGVAAVGPVPRQAYVEAWLSGSAIRRASRGMLQRNAAIVRQNHDNKKTRP